MSIKLGDTAPNFQADSSLGELDFYNFLGDSWGILFSHPADYTPVCTTELGMTSKPVSYTHLDVYKRQVQLEHQFLSEAGDKLKRKDSIEN